MTYLFKIFFEQDIYANYQKTGKKEGEKKEGKPESNAKIKTCHHSAHGLVGASNNLYQVETSE